MNVYENMSVNQAMLHIAGYDIYLKWQEDTDASAEDWFDLDTSFNRAYEYRYYLTQLWNVGNGAYRPILRQLETHYENEPVFRHDLEKGSKEWFTQLGYCLYSIKHPLGYFSSRYYANDRMQAFLSAIDDDVFTDYLTEQISDGETNLRICDDCGAFTSHLTETSEETYVCNHCLGNDYCYDDYHGDWFYSHRAVDALDASGDRITLNGDANLYNFHWSDDHDCYVHDEYEDESDRIIRSYHSNGDSYYQVDSAWSKANKRHFGVELEVECQADREESAQQIHDWFATNRPANEQLFYEEDGSLNEGFEMISQPMGLDKHREIWKWVEQKNLIRNLRSHNTSTCGLHVHVSKAGLTALTISKAVCFVNNPSNKALIKAIARRYSSGYCRAKHVTLADGAKRGDKYEMINLNKSQTIEFRIFRGSLNYNAIQASIEFSNAVLNFAASTSMEELTELKFLEFLYKPEQRMDTKFLRAYLEQRSARIKDIVDKQIKPTYNLRVVKPQPVETTPDEPAQTPPSRARGSSRSNISYPEDIPPINPNAPRYGSGTLNELIRDLDEPVCLDNAA